MGTAGLSFFFGREPVMATVMMQGIAIRKPHAINVTQRGQTSSPSNYAE
jgi:hypothetical protein